jgi:predicted enzyme related to lactoylglutathione lyase
VPAATPKFLAPLLIARDFEATLGFYRDTIGLPFRGASPYAECRTPSSLFAVMDGAFLAQTGEFDLPYSGSGATTSPTVLSIEVENLEATFERLAQVGVKFLSAPSSRLPLGRRYLFLRDPDGRTLALMGPRFVDPE